VQVSDAIIIHLSVPSEKQLPAVPSSPDQDTTAARPGKKTGTDKKIQAAKSVTENEITSTAYTTNKASVKFFSSTTEEDIEATNSQVISSLNGQTGQVMFAALIKGFHFENELMQNHFNDKEYMNSDLYPKSEFKGSITDIKNVSFSKEGTYPVIATGILTIHGITQKITVTGILAIQNGKLVLKSVFKIKKADYGITTNEVADILEITVSCKYD